MIDIKDVSIIIPHLGGTEETERALDLCLDSLDEYRHQIILATNGLKSEYKGDIHIQKQGQGIAVNAAVVTTNTPWIFVSNDDHIYAPNWFENLTKLQDENSKFWCMSPKLVEPKQGAPTFIVEPFGGAGGDFNKQGWLDYAKAYDKKGCIRGFNLPFFIRRELWDTVGGYDINYDPWGSNGDSDLEYKILLAGVQPYQMQNSIVYHFSQTSGTFEPKNDEYRNRNYAYFKTKWGFDRTDDGIWEASFKIPTKEEGRIYLPEWEGKYGL